MKLIRCQTGAGQHGRGMMQNPVESQGVEVLIQSNLGLDLTQWKKTRNIAQVIDLKQVRFREQPWGANLPSLFPSLEKLQAQFEKLLQRE